MIARRAIPTRIRTFVALLAIAAGASACVASGGVASTEPVARFAFRLLGTQSFAHRLEFGGTIVGGLSGIDRDPSRDVYYLVSDDRSVFSPNRFYTARLSIDERGFHDAALQTVVTLRAPDGRPYPENVADSEAIRFDPRTRSLWWASEGARKLKAGRRGEPRLIDPFVRNAALDGRHLGEVPLDPMFRITSDARGPRDNLVFEGLSLSAGGDALWVSTEGPLLQDGPMATMSSGAWSRISHHPRRADGSFGALDAQYAYRIDPIPSPAGAGTSWRAQTGVSEILAIDDTHLFVLERALVIGSGWRIRLFEADVAGASDVRLVDSLVATGASFRPVAKTLALDFDTLGVHIDNLEGVCFGPTLPNGHRTLVFVSDDNFNPGQTTQLVALEMIPR